MIRQFLTTIKWFANSVRMQTNKCTAVAPPPATSTKNNNKGLPFDPASFNLSLSVYALKVPPKLCNSLRRQLKPHILNIPRVHSVLKSHDTTTTTTTTPPAHIYLLLKYLAFAASPQQEELFSNAPLGNIDQTFSSDLPQSTSVSMEKKKKKQVAQHLEEAKNNSKQSTSISISDDMVTVRDITLTYDQWSSDAVLRRLLPKDITVPSSFETVGQLIHLNLRDEQLPYKHLIGCVLLHKLSPRIKTVVNKVSAIGGQFRVFPLEVLAGDSSTEVKLKENGCRFHLDMAKVYWNSRLETEHRRIVDRVVKSDVFVDAFAGIGPFVIPAAVRNKCARIYANDLNPASMHYLRMNMRNNHVKPGRIITANECARDFLRRLVAVEAVPVTKVVMNFPAGAPEFLDVFRGLYATYLKDDGTQLLSMPMPEIFCYCFIKDSNNMDEARNRVRSALFDGNTDPNTTMPDGLLEVRNVRDVAPRKIQVCVSFRIPESVAYWKDVHEEQARKKPKLMSATDA